MCEGLEMYISVLEDSHIIILKHFWILNSVTGQIDV